MIFGKLFKERLLSRKIYRFHSHPLLCYCKHHRIEFEHAINNFFGHQCNKVEYISHRDFCYCHIPNILELFPSHKFYPFGYKNKNQRIFYKRAHSIENLRGQYCDPYNFPKLEDISSNLWCVKILLYTCYTNLD